jgi:DNA-binding Lrp family transcriptional regulator
LNISDEKLILVIERFILSYGFYYPGEAMAIGFILISTAPAKEHDVYNALKKIKEIVELHPLFGEYDLIAKLEAKNFNLLGQIVVDKIRTIPGVVDTKTLTGIKF